MQERKGWGEGGGRENLILDLQSLESTDLKKKYAKINTTVHFRSH